MMAIFDEYKEVLLQGAPDSYDDTLSYHDTSASSHMAGKKSLFQSIDESQ